MVPQDRKAGDSEAKEGNEIEPGNHNSRPDLRDPNSKGATCGLNGRW